MCVCVCVCVIFLHTISNLTNIINTYRETHTYHFNGAIISRASSFNRPGAVHPVDLLVAVVAVQGLSKLEIGYHLPCTVVHEELDIQNVSEVEPIFGVGSCRREGEGEGRGGEGRGGEGRERKNY